MNQASQNPPAETVCTECGTRAAETVCHLCKAPRSTHDFRDTPLTLKADRFAVPADDPREAGMVRGRL